MSADKLASFRIDNQLWQQFQDVAKSQNTTASALLISYIKSVVNTGDTINTTVDTVNTTTEKKPSLSIQNVNTLSIQDVDNRIKLSIQDGDIGAAIATFYATTMNQFNLLVDQVHELKSQLSAIRSQESAPIIDPVPSEVVEVVEVVNSESAPITDHQLPTNHQEINDLIGIGDIVANKGNKDFKVYIEYVKEQGINEKIREHQETIEKCLNIKLSLEDKLTDLKAILKAMNYELKESRNKAKNMINSVACEVTSSNHFILL